LLGIALVLLLEKASGAEGPEPWVVPIEQPAIGAVKGGLTQSGASGLNQTGEPSVRERLGQLNASEWSILQALEVKGYLPEADVQAVVLPNLPQAQINGALQNLVSLHLIRTAGVEPQRMIILSESLLRALTGVSAPKDPIPASPAP